MNLAFTPTPSEAHLDEIYRLGYKHGNTKGGAYQPSPDYTSAERAAYNEGFDDGADELIRSF
jgi:hypothetical protein